jgi:putative ABC transport system permease protein
MVGLWQDLQYGFRVMRKNPGFTAVAVFTLALGIGANTIIFSLLNGILLRPLPFAEPENLVRITQTYPEKGLTTWRLSQANFAHYRDNNKVFSAVAAYGTTGVNLTRVESPERLQASRVTGDFFRVLGVEPAQGRTFRPEEDAPGKNNVCVLSHGLWQRRFGGDPQIIGKSLVLNDAPTEVIGIMPASFKFPAPETEIWLPLGLNPQQANPWFLTGIGRLKPGVSPEQAQADTTVILLNMGQQNPQLVSRSDPPPPGAGLKTNIVPLKEAIIGNTEKHLLILQFAVGFVLLIACANVANLLLSRAGLRTREISVRLTIGATPRRVIRQLLTESLLLALLGALLGIALAWWGVSMLSKLPLEGIPRIGEVTVSWPVLIFTLVVAVLTGGIFGLVPALRTYKLGLTEGLNEGTRGSTGTSSRRMNTALVVVQLALSLVLLIGAGLVLKSFQRLMSVDPGFKSENVMTMVLPPSTKKYPEPAQVIQFYQGLLENVRRLPGVTSASITSTLPFSGEEMSDGYIVEGHEPAGAGDAPQTQFRITSPGYFQTLSIALKRGRDFQDTDRQNAPPVTIIDETLARQYWPDGDALGKRIRLTGDPTWFTVIGVVSGVKDQNLADEMEPHMYFAHSQVGQARMYLVARTAGEPTALTPAIRNEIRRLDADVPIHSVRSLTEVVNQTLNSQRLINFLLTAFAALALVLAAIGIYGVMSVYVTSRTREFGIRLALGAQPRDLLYSVLREGLLLAGAGIVVGIIGAFILTRTVSSLLFEVSATDPLVFTGLPLLLIAVASLTCYLPARRAARTNPLSALRHE